MKFAFICPTLYQRGFLELSLMFQTDFTHRTLEHDSSQNFSFYSIWSGEGL